jgi:tetraacyldisaccharide 4'-kinase
MDDGLQNPTLAKTASLLVVDGATGFGNGLLFPAGPLREPVFAAASRCLAAVVMGPDVSGTRSLFDIRLPILHSTLMQDEQASVLAGQRTLAFTGIAFPNKFFSNLENSGLKIVKRKAFPDHHVFTNSEILQLEAEARDLDAVLVTTPKDAVRLPKTMAVHVMAVNLAWKTEAAVEVLLDELAYSRNTRFPFVC